MDFRRSARRALLALALCSAMSSRAGTALAANFKEFVDPHPAPGNRFGDQVVPLSTGRRRGWR